MQKFSRNYQVRSYECDEKGDLRLVTLMNLLQDMADTHAGELGFGLDFCLQNGLAWFGANYHVKIERLPKIHENILIETWPSVKKKIGAVRDFRILDQEGNPIVVASSLWILIDFARKKPVMLDAYIKDYQPLQERALASDFVRLSLPSRIDQECGYNVRYDDLDFNHHVNNSIYLLWAAECMGAEFLAKHTPSEIEISYKKECKLGDEVFAKMEMSDLSSICAIESSTGEVLTQLRLNWREI